MNLNKSLEALANLKAVQAAGLKAPVQLLMAWALCEAMRRRGLIEQDDLTGLLDLMQQTPSAQASPELFAAAEQAKMLLDFALLDILFPDTDTPNAVG